MQTCPHCHRSDQRVKNGLNAPGSQRCRCQACQRAYTPEPALHCYAEQTRRRAIQLHVEGLNLRRIGRLLGVHLCYVNSMTRHLPAPNARTVAGSSNFATAPETARRWFRIVACSPYN